jgi:hypothetical protein
MAKAIGESLFRVSRGDPRVVERVYSRVLAKEAALLESWFRDAIAAEPLLVEEPCRAGGLVAEDERWFHWATEHNTDAGPIDVLLVSSHGRIGVVETKLSFNPERRREVVAQIIDYALALQDAPLQSFPPLPTVDGSPVASELDLGETLREGRFLLVIAGDAMDPRAVRLSEGLLARNLTSGWDLALVDVNPFLAGGESLLLAPELRGALIHETRQVVRVVIQGETPAAKVEVERVSQDVVRGAREQRRAPWTVEEVCDFLQDEQKAAGLRGFAGFVEDRTGLTLEGGLGRTVPTLSLRRPDDPERLATIWFTRTTSTLNVAVRAKKLLGPDLDEEGLVARLRQRRLQVPDRVSNDGYLTVSLPWTMEEGELEGLFAVVV